MRYKVTHLLLTVIAILAIVFLSACSTKKNTALSRAYHSINTRYNIHFNANEAYKEAIEAKQKKIDENLSEMIYIYPDASDTTEIQKSEDFTTTIDKCTKAIKLHSIKTRPTRDPNKRNDAQYQAWVKQKEFNPFMDQVWILLAKSEYENGDYLRAITTFMYISKIYGSNEYIVAECNLWVARSYTEMGWMYEAGNILHKMELAGGPPEKLNGFYASVKANHLIRSEEYKAAIPYLVTAISKENNKTHKTRMKYLLGQLYTQAGDTDNAYKAYGAVKGLSTPYKYKFNAELSQIGLKQANEEDAIKKLKRMAKSSKNKEYLDQIYYTEGNIYLQQSDTTHAIDSYHKAIKESTRNGYDKAMNQIALGGLYFDQRHYINAQPCYSEALLQLKKTHKDYQLVSLRSEVLDQLVVHAKVVYEQDSLQHLALLPENERIQIIEKKIADIKKAEKEAKDKAEYDKQVDDRNDRISDWGDLEKEAFSYTPPKQDIAKPNNTFGKKGNAASFYFYNEQTVAQGKVAFQKQWGNRKPEDDWRRKNKTAVGSFQNIEEIVEKIEPSVHNDDWGDISGSPALINNDNSGNLGNEDIYSVNYYMQQLPLTEEAMNESNELIENGLFNMGKIYKSKLGDLNLAIDAYATDLERFPNTPNREEIYYELFLIYMQLNNSEQMAIYRSAIIQDFPEGQYAIPLSESDYEWNFRHLAALQDSIYNETYDAYISGNTSLVRSNYKSIASKYPFGDLMPKFELLNALTYAQTRDIAGLDKNLQDLVEKHPKSEVAPLATDIINRIKEGEVLLSDGTAIRSLDWSNAYTTDSINDEPTKKLLAYSDSLDIEYMLLLVLNGENPDRNQLLYEVADYNFTNYVVQTFDLKFDKNKGREILEISGFKTFANIKSYVDKAIENGGLLQRIDTSIVPIPISAENYHDVYPKLGLENYLSFFKENYDYLLPQLIAYWDGNDMNIKPQDQLVAEVKPKTEPFEKPIFSEARPMPKPTGGNKNNSGSKPTGRDDDKKEINADDLLTKDQLQAAGKVNETLESVEDILSNPVDGLKGLFNKLSNKTKLTKEEKQELEDEKKAEKQRQKELKAIEKAKTDSINKIEKLTQDSIAKVELVKEKTLDAIEQAKKDAIKSEAKIKDDARKLKEADRKEAIRLQKERQNQKEKERKEKEKTTTEKRKQREKEQKEKEKSREQERKLKEKAAEEKRKEREKRTS